MTTIRKIIIKPEPADSPHPKQHSVKTQQDAEYNPGSYGKLAWQGKAKPSQSGTPGKLTKLGKQWEAEQQKASVNADEQFKAGADQATASGNCRTSHSPLPWRLAGGMVDGYAIISEHHVVVSQKLPSYNARFIVRACNNVDKLSAELERCRDLLIAYKVAFPNHFSDLDARFGADVVIKSAYQALQDAGVPNAQKGGQ